MAFIGFPGARETRSGSKKDGSLNESSRYQRAFTAPILSPHSIPDHADPRAFLAYAYVVFGHHAQSQPRSGRQVTRWPWITNIPEQIPCACGERNRTAQSLVSSRKASMRKGLILLLVLSP